MFTLDHEHLNIWLRKTGFWNNKCTGDGPNILTNKSIWNLIMDKGRNISGVLSCSKLMLHFCTRSGKKNSFFIKFIHYQQIIGKSIQRSIAPLNDNIGCISLISKRNMKWIKMHITTVCSARLLEKEICCNNNMFTMLILKFLLILAYSYNYEICVRFGVHFSAISHLFTWLYTLHVGINGSWFCTLLCFSYCLTAVLKLTSW